MDEATPFLSTAQVAKALGVGVSTVKRWVDEELLPAHRTPGGHRKLLLADVVRLSRDGRFPRLDLSRLVGKAPAAGTDLGRASRDLSAALLKGDDVRVRYTIQQAYYGGVPVEALADHVVAPAMNRLGECWEAGKIDVLHEHHGTHLVSAALYELRAKAESPPASGRPVAVGGGPEGDPYVVANLLIELLLHDLGWRVVSLGPNTPLESFAKAAHEFRPRLLWLSASHLTDADQFVRDYRRFYDRVEHLRVPVAIGGQALTPELRLRLPYSTYGDGLANLAAFARTLHEAPRRPARGRPRSGE